MTEAVADQQLPLVFIPKFREYGVQVLDGGTSFLALSFCPWCATKLPSSLRDQWFDEMERLGVDPLVKNAVPEIYRGRP